LRTLPTLLEVACDGSPMLIGAFRPAIVIPATTLRRLSAAEQTMVLGHELAHVRRRDVLWGLAASLVRAVFFFHPLVWLSERQLKLAQEVAADELVISKQRHDPIGYGNLLLSVVGKLGSRRLASTVSLETAGPVHSLTRRLVAMTRIGRTSRRVLVGSGILLGAMVLLGIVPWRLVAVRHDGSLERSPSVGEGKITEGGKDLPHCLLAQCLPTATPVAPEHLDAFASVRIDGCGSYDIVVSEHGTRVAMVDRHTGKSNSLDVPKNVRVTDVFEGDNCASCKLRGNPVSHLVVFNKQFGTWSTFRLPGGDRPRDAEPIVGDHVVCYPLKGRTIAYSIDKDTWGMLATDVEPAVGDYAVFVQSATERSEFTAESGVWVAVNKSATATSR
jgi:hypothetical protein